MHIQMKPLQIGISAYALALCCCLVHVNSFAGELRAACATNRPPYCFLENGEFKGIEVRLLKAAMSQSNHELKFQDIPKNRLTTALKQNEVDIVATVQNNAEANIFYSAPYLEFQNVVVSKARNQLHLSSLQDLKKYSFIIWQGGWKNLGSDFEELFRPDQQGKFPKNYFEAFNQLNQNKMFWADRVQLIIIDRRIFEYHRQLLSKEFDTTEALSYHDIIKSKTAYMVGFRQDEWRKQFEEGMKKLRATGEAQAIIDNHY